MKSNKGILCTAFATILLLLAPAVHADIISLNTGGTILSGFPAYFGQSFYTLSGGPWSQITFNFFSNVPAATPTAAGEGFLLTKEYTGTPADLSPSTPGFLAESTEISGGKYIFNPLLLLRPYAMYFFYSNYDFATGAVSGGNVVPYISGYFADSEYPNFLEGYSTNFEVSGTVSTVPEPAELLLLCIGLGAVCFGSWCWKK